MGIREQIQIEIARRDFFEYCKLMHGGFYKDDREYLKEMCNLLQDFYYNDDEFMIINVPPRHGKSFTATNFVGWILGQNPKERVMSASYSHGLSKKFSESVRDTIREKKLGGKMVYCQVFPETRIKFGKAGCMAWQTSASEQVNYLATSPKGSATGFGCTLMIIDDVVKNAYEANNKKILDEQFEWFTNTMLSRREGKKKVLLISTRWSSKDLCGRVLEFVKKENIKYTHVNYAAEVNESEMLCEEIFDKATAERTKIFMGEDIYEANYNQKPIDKKGVLYTSFMTYNSIPEFEWIENYTDTADQGNDYLCSITYGVHQNKAYIIDVVYTRDHMEVTEPLMAKKMLDLRVNKMVVESNNGGRGFKRNVERISREDGNSFTVFTAFTQTKNKVARILSSSTGVMQNVMFPMGWEDKFPEFYKEVSEYQRIGKNEHDDGVDALTGVYERLERRKSGQWTW